MKAATYIIALARSFPSLRTAVPRDPKNWDIDQFMNWLPRASNGEKHAMLFIANVWNPNNAKAKGWEFDFFEAFGTWDTSHRDAFTAWTKFPVWP